MAIQQRKERLTEQPRNLKEAIDWVLRVTGLDDSAEQVNDTADVEELNVKASSILKNGKANKVNAKGATITRKQNKFNYDTVQRSIRNLSYAVAKLLSNAQSKECPELPDKLILTFKCWFVEDELCCYGPISKFASGLAFFMGYEKGQMTRKGFANKGIYESSYDSRANWQNFSNDEQVATIFLQAVLIIYPLLATLYWRCKGDEDGTRNYGPWQDYRIDGSDGHRPLRKFLEKAGFSISQINANPVDTKGNTHHNVGKVIALTLGYYYPEFETAYKLSKTNKLAEFMKRLKMNTTSDTVFLKRLAIEAVDDLNPADETRSPSVLSSGPDTFYITRLYVVAHACLNATGYSVSSKILKIVGGITAGVGLTAGAIVTNGFGLLPIIAAFCI
ncbi:variant erythrocyte surface antigen-1 family protein [Babesia caballi]|uniref:Variant erythrocyte surface antigen-1 family protein n=1 Tax=Babesia caballi TaxID=5871 RepID=A0AAV4LV30_BABCB|nr:variant erythrocyte surface antigen-1 family protein [Babesia caballi]